MLNGKLKIIFYVEDDHTRKDIKEEIIDDIDDLTCDIYTIGKVNDLSVFKGSCEILMEVQMIE
jgi:hypothetical protein